MFWRTLSSLLISTLFITSAYGQDVVIYSKKSDETTKKLKELINSLSDKVILKTFNLKTVAAETSASTEYTGKSFEVDESLGSKAVELTNAKLQEFIDKAKKLDKKDLKAQIPIMQKEYIQAVSDELAKLKDSSLAPLNEAIKKLNAESELNNSRFKALKDAEADKVDGVVKDILKNLKEAYEEAVISSNGEPVTEIKKIADETTHRESEEKFPFPNKKEKEAEAVKKFPKFKVGDKVSFTFFPTPTRPQKASGQIRSMTRDKIKVGFSTVNIDDIKDPIMRDGMRPAVTDKNRKDYVDKIFADIRKERNRYYNSMLQPNVEKIIAENEKKGFILASGKWQTPASYSTSLLTQKMEDWRKEKLNMIEKAILEDGKLINSIEANRDGYSKPITETLDKFKEDVQDEGDQVIAEKSSNENVEFSDADLQAILAEEEKKKAAEEEKKKQEAAEKKKQQQAINKKKQLLDKQNTQPEETGSGSLIMIAVVLLLVGGAAFVFFNPKIRNKIIPGGKKKSMEDVISNLAPPGAPQPDGALPMPGGPTPPPGGGSPGAVAPPPGVPAGMGAPAGGGDTEKTKIDLDGDVSIVKRDTPEEAPQAAPRKKISLNLGSSTSSLSAESLSAEDAGKTQESIDSGSIGGLTPPGGAPAPAAGGLTPPGGGGLTPPGGGGLTPPGGGLKPPGGGGLTPPGGGGLTPPGGGLKPPGGEAPESDDSGDDPENEDKSNLILNPNLDGSGSKLRLKK